MLALQALRASPAVTAAVLGAIERPAPVSAADLDRIVREVKSVARPGEQTVTLARIYLWLGRYDLVPGSEGVTSFSTTHWEPGFPGFRNSAAFKKMLREQGIPEYWREKGFPPLCRAVGAKDVTCD
jgi:hypothetical protein